ncbi:MAG: lysostaphin resistance A-like protein [Lysobacterales bacterium]
MNKKARLGLELIIVSLIFMGFRALFEFKYASQVGLVLCLIVITVLMKYRNISWKDLGLRRPKPLWKAIVLTVLCVISIGVIFNFVIQPLFPHGAHDINQGQAISLGEMLFQLFFIGILAAAIGEEMLFRGYLLNTLNEVFGKNLIGTTGAVLVQALIFGVLHSGVQGMISAGTIGLILGIFYVASNRNLPVVMVAHAVPDILSIVSSYQSQQI